jgi:hypothetical protein
LIGPCLAIVEDAICSKLSRFIIAVIKRYSPADPPPTFVESGFYECLTTAIENRFSSAAADRIDDPAILTPPPQQLVGPKRLNALPAIAILKALCSSIPSKLEPHAISLVRFFKIK